MRFKNVSGDDLDVPALGQVVKAGDIVEASGPTAAGLEGSPLWQRTDTPARKKAAKRTAGGKVTPSTPSLVGEKGPEIFVPGATNSNDETGS